MQTPTVSFIVPCYKLAHLLSECVESILSQTYRGFEVLIMDDCSPDYTSEVARSFHDLRVTHVRNEETLGHLRNYNKGISLSRGKYIWLISADDSLRAPYILERYVDVLEKHPNVGYAFCPAMGVRAGFAPELLEYSTYGDSNRIINGRAFLPRLLRHNGIVAASAIARRECYEQEGYFPLQPGMEWSGDWYLWCAFALQFDVAYFAEPMVYYREHQVSMTSRLISEQNLSTCLIGDLAVHVMIRRRADHLGLKAVSRMCRRSLVSEYSRQLFEKRYSSAGQVMTTRITPDSFENSLVELVPNPQERQWVRARVLAQVADRFYSAHNRTRAKEEYELALAGDPWMLRVRTKLVLLALGQPGAYMRSLFASLRRLTHQTSRILHN